MKIGKSVKQNERQIIFWDMLGQVTPSLKVERVVVLQIFSLREKFLNIKKIIPLIFSFVVPVHTVLRI